MELINPNEQSQEDDAVELQDQVSGQSFEEANLTASFATVGLPHVPDPKR